MGEKGLPTGTILITAITALLTLLSGIILNHVQQQDKLKQDRMKFEYDLISNTLSKSTDYNTVWQSLKFYSQLGLITTISPDSLGKILNTTNFETAATTVTTEGTHAVGSERRSGRSSLRRNAFEMECKAYRQLVKGNTDMAAQLFYRADSIYPGYHNSYELSKLLKSNKGNNKLIYSTILSDYTWGIPRSVVDSLQIQLEKK